MDHEPGIAHPWNAHQRAKHAARRGFDGGLSEKRGVTGFLGTDHDSAKSASGKSGRAFHGGRDERVGGANGDTGVCREDNGGGSKPRCARNNSHPLYFPPSGGSLGDDSHIQ